MATCFKIIDRKKRSSICTKGKLRRVYPVGVPVRALVGGLLAFKTERQARRLVKAIYAERTCCVVPAIGRYPVKLPPRRLGRMTLDDAIDYWHGRKDGVFPWEPGAVAYREITCLK